MIKTSIYHTVEMDAASRDFDYENYLHLHKAVDSYARVLSKESYIKVCEILNLEISIDYDKAQTSADYEKLNYE